MAALGIDFGSSYTTASWINPRNGRPETIKFNGDGFVKYPSVIMGIESGLILGYQALSYLEEVYQIPNVTKRFESLANFVPSIKRVLSPDGVELIGDKEYSHFQLLTIFFSQIKALAKSHCGNNINFDTAIISHPVDFPSAKVNMLTQALLSSGFINVDTKLEPIAAVLGYSNDHEIKNEEGILVFDYGGGTTDVAFVKKRFGKLNLLCEPKSDLYCGGQDIDILLYEELRKKIRTQYDVEISYSGMIDYGVLNSCRRLKEYFSGSNDSYDTSVLFVKNENIITYKYKLNRETFENIIYQKVADAINVARMVVEQTQQKKHNIDKVLLIGGSSQLTLVRKMLSDILPGITIDTCGEKDVAVALGNITEEKNVTKEIPPQKVREQKGDQQKKDNLTKNSPLPVNKTESEVVYIHNDDGKMHINW